MGSDVASNTVAKTPATGLATSSTGYKGTARPPAPPPSRGFTARRGGSKKTSLSSTRIAKDEPKPVSSSTPPSFVPASGTKQDVRSDPAARKADPPATVMKPLKVHVPVSTITPNTSPTPTPTTTSADQVAQLPPRRESSQHYDRDDNTRESSVKIKTEPYHSSPTPTRSESLMSATAESETAKIQSAKSEFTEGESTKSEKREPINRGLVKRETSSNSVCEPHSNLNQAGVQLPPPAEDTVEPERQTMARSIIAGFPRRALETLLLQAGMRDKDTMREIIAWNSQHPIEEEYHQPNSRSTSLQSASDGFGMFEAYNTHSAAQNRARSYNYSSANIGMSMVTRNPTISIPAQSSSTDQKIEESLRISKRRRELGEEFKPHAIPEKRQRIDQSPSISSPLEPRAKLDQPLSLLTQGMTHIPLIDIEAYVNRPLEERLQEAENNKIPGKVKRPMNSFMLYRKAYQHRAKEYGLMINHQVVSQLCGDSWAVELEEVKEQFAIWANIDRERHEEAHTGYKFTPSRPGDGATFVDELMD